MSDQTPHSQLRGLTVRVGESEHAITRLQELVGEIIDDVRNTPSPFHWDDLDPGERGRREALIREWVDQVLSREHPHVGRRLPGCWFDHPHTRALVTGSWLAWEGAYRAKGRRASDPDDWVTIRLPRLDAALVALFGDGREPCEEHGAR